MRRLSVVAALTLASLLSAAPAAAQGTAPTKTAPAAPTKTAPAAPTTSDAPTADEQPTAPPPESPVPEPVPDPSSTPIPPEPTPGITPAPGSPADSSTNEADKRIGVGIDLLFLLPVGVLARETGPLLGPVVRFGYRVIPALEVAMRAGYVFASSKDQGAGVVSRYDLLPVSLFVRYFFVNPFVGPYASVDAGMNLYLPLREPPIPGPAGDAVTRGRWRFGANIGFGWVLSTSFPIDIRAQFLMLNLAGRDDKLGEKTHVGLGLSAGYTLQF